MYIVTPKVAHRQRGDYLILSDLAGGGRYFLQGPVIEIWLGLKNGVPKDEVVSYLESHYGVEAIDYWESYTEQFLEAGLILETDQTIQRRSGINWITREKEEFYINKAGLVVTESCNFRCVHCYNGSGGVDDSPLTLAEWEQVIRELKELGCLEVQITGGEPFSHPDLFAILDLLEEHQFAFDILSNGSLITEEMMEKLQGYHLLRSILISLYGLTPDTYRTVTGRTVNPAQIIQTYRDLLAKGIRTDLKYVHMTPNYEDALELADFEARHGLSITKNLELIHAPLGGGENGDLNLTLEEVETLYQSQAIQLASDSNPLVQCGRERISINSQGEVSICEKLSDLTFGNIRGTSLREIWQSPQVAEFLNSCRPADQCQACSVQEYCIRCNGLSYLETGSPNQPVEQLCRLAQGVSKIFEG